MSVRKIPEFGAMEAPPAAEAESAILAYAYRAKPRAWPPH